MYNILYTNDMIDVLKTEEFVKWLKRLKGTNAKARINLRIRRLTLAGNIGDTKTIGEVVYEMRVDYGPGIGFTVPNEATM